MRQVLEGMDLVSLIRKVFRIRPEDKGIGILVDLPNKYKPDHVLWKKRREMAFRWFKEICSLSHELENLDIHLFLYENVGAHNAELPENAYKYDQSECPDCAEMLDKQLSVPFEKVFESCQIIIAPTEYSATAPLKLQAHTFGFRAATMPGFKEEMIPALMLDYEEIAHRTNLLSDMLGKATGAEVVFGVDGLKEYQLYLDLRFRKGHASDGRLHEPGMVGNLPPGEGYIAPYEGEVEGQESRSRGHLPVQFFDEVVVYRVEHNRAVSVETEGVWSRRERELLEREPAYGNIAEIGFGVLGDMGLKPTQELLLDEKLGLHIAFGRSDHFGGHTGEKAFSKPEAVVHIDRVYIPETQPRIKILSVDLIEIGKRIPIIKDDQYVIEWGNKGVRDTKVQSFKSPLHEMCETTKTDFWNDSCCVKELEYAIEHGAVGATTNPPIVLGILKKEEDVWKEWVQQAIKDFPNETEIDIAIRLIEAMGVRGAKVLEPVFRRYGGRKGRLSIQVPPTLYRDANAMIEYAKRFHRLAPNIQVKLPVTKAGLIAIEEATAYGVNINATVCFSVPQSIAVALAVERGLDRAKANGIDISQMSPVCTIMVGRLDDYIQVLSERDDVVKDPIVLHWAGVAVMKKAYNIYKSRGYRTRLLAAAYRHILHWTEFVGGDITLTIPYIWQRRFNASNVKPELRMNIPVDEHIIEQLRNGFSDFIKAYEEDGMSVEEFDHYGATRRTLRSFIYAFYEIVSFVRDVMLPDPDKK